MLLQGAQAARARHALAAAQPPPPLDIGGDRALFAPGAAALAEALPRLLGPADVEPLMVQAEELRAGRRAARPRAARRRAGDDVLDARHRRDRRRSRASTSRRWPRSTSGSATRLDLHWLRDRIVELPRDDRWGALARAALRDDLYSLHRSLTAEVLRQPDRDADAWVDRNPAAERCMQTLAEIRVGHVFDTTTLPVAVREVRNLLQAGSRS